MYVKEIQIYVELQRKIGRYQIYISANVLKVLTSLGFLLLRNFSGRHLTRFFCSHVPHGSIEITKTRVTVAAKDDIASILVQF